MEISDIFNKPMEKIVLPYSARHKRDLANLASCDSKVQNIQSNTETESDRDYIQEYVKEEENLLLTSSSLLNNVPGNGRKLDEVSVGSVSIAQELEDEKFTKIYKTYGFAHRLDCMNNLTISSMKDKIIAMIETNPVVVIQGPTGCGKTTQVPQYILDSCVMKKVHCNIVVTQPRRIAAMSIAKRVSEERQWPLGTLVGFQVGMIKNVSDDTRLTYCTTGVLLHKLINSKNMLEYTHVILDEVHERDQDLDFLLLVVRKLLRTNSRNVKVVLMSATIDVDKFAKYFSSPVVDKLIPAPVTYVEKRSYYNVNIYYASEMPQLGQLPEMNIDEPKVTPQILEFCRRLIVVLDSLDVESPDVLSDVEMGQVNKRHAILIFLPGIHEIEELYALLSEPKHKISKWDIVVLHSTITNNEQQRIFVQPPHKYRRIILSTNIAESSITVPDVKYVIDFCLTKQLVTDPKTNFQCLELAWASKANCDQRAGRTGRVMDGRVYRLVPKNFYEMMLPQESDPEMLRAPLENLVLKAKILDMGEPKALLALSLDPPNLSNLERTILILKEAGALLSTTDDEMQHYDGELTDLGRVMAQLPLDIHISKLIMLGHVYSVLRDAIIIAASMFSKNMFSSPFGQKLSAYNARFTWAQESASDCIAFLNVYKVWMNEKASRRVNSNISEKRWAQRHFVQIRVLREVDALVQDITCRLKRMGIDEVLGIDKVVWTDSERPFILKVVIAGAFYPNYFVRTLRGADNKEYEGIKILGGLDPLKTVYLQGWPLRQPGMLYARKIQSIFKDVTSKTGKVKVSFDSSSRVYVEFSKADGLKNADVEISRKISPSVYKAIKMRRCRTPIEVPLLNEEEAIQRAEALNLGKKSFIFLNEKSISENKPTTTSMRPQLPPLDISTIPLQITYVIDPGHFWAYINDTDTSQKLEKISNLLNNQKVVLKEFNQLPPPGATVAAPYNNESEIEYRRAVIKGYETKLQENFAQVLYIDYGCKGPVRACDLKQLVGELTTIPAMALECVLANCKPSILHNSDGKWLPAALDMFEQIIQEKSKLYAEIYSIVNSIVAVKLFCVRKSGEQFSINDVLIDKGFATFKEEDYISRSNHAFRTKHMEMTVQQRKYYEELQYDQEYLSDDYPDPPGVNECSSVVQLRGPFSPLEIELSHLTIAGKGKKVTVDINSVNSVLLDPEMETSYDRLLVAGCVTQSSTGSMLQVRNTTFMPNIPGLTALLSLIFCPSMELRRNNFGTCYIGALCGLGYDPKTNTSLFREHDMEIQFDVEITIDDLQEINRLRHWMSIGMQINTQIDEAINLQEITACQNKIKTSLFKLMEKTRKKQNYQSITNFSKWGRYDESLLLRPGKATMIRNNVYNLHTALELEERDIEFEEMMQHLAELKTVAIDEAYKLKDIHCKFCKKDIFGNTNLCSHLFSEEHKENEKKYRVY